MELLAVTFLGALWSLSTSVASLAARKLADRWPPRRTVAVSADIPF